MDLRIQKTKLLNWLLVAVAAAGIISFAERAGVAPARAGPAPAIVARAISLTGQNAKTNFSLELSASVDFSVFALADPYRVVIDLPEIEFRIPARAQKKRGLIKAYRFGLFSPGKSRIVIDASGPVAISEPVISGSRESAKLEFSFTPTSRARFLRDFALNGRVRSAAKRPPPTVSSLINATRRTTGKPVIVIDPGHGGIDSGTSTRAGTQEKDIVLKFSMRLRDKLATDGRFNVKLTRAGDRFVALAARRELARKARADLFISVHADSIRNKSVRGSTVYTLSDDASDEVAAALAIKENKSDLIAGVALGEVSGAVSDILIDLAQRETNNLSVDFSVVLIAKLKRKVKLNKNPHRSASFVVLKAPDVPSVLLELGYLSNKKDAGKLGSARWQRRAVQAINDAISQYFRSRLAQMR
ncbi:MAG: N-acetylmuramoyl-L-alanine amidase [Alphaproteobacteria bacterium]